MHISSHWAIHSLLSWFLGVLSSWCTLLMSVIQSAMAFHPQTDGHSAVANTILGVYLHCLARDRPNSSSLVAMGRVDALPGGLQAWASSLISHQPHLSKVLAGDKHLMDRDSWHVFMLRRSWNANMMGAFIRTLSLTPEIVYGCVFTIVKLLLLLTRWLASWHRGSMVHFRLKLVLFLWHTGWHSQLRPKFTMSFMWCFSRNLRAPLQLFSCRWSSIEEFCLSLKGSFMLILALECGKSQSIWPPAVQQMLPGNLCNSSLNTTQGRAVSECGRSVVDAFVGRIYAQEGAGLR